MSMGEIEEIDPGTAGLEHIRSELSRASGPAFWRRLEELAASAPFLAFLRREFPSQAERFGSELPRREFLRLMGASLAVCGLGACTRQPKEKIFPYARSPEAVIPGRPRFFATVMPREGDALGLLVESHMNRPTKVEGNPDHPSSLGATDLLAQAATLSLYDPDRSQSLLRAGQISTWDTFLTEISGKLDGLDALEGEGLRILTEEVRSPTLIDQLQRLTAKLPRARWHRWTPLHRDNALRGAELAFGRAVTTRYAFDRARVVVALDADFLAAGPGGVRHARDFATARRGRTDAKTMNRLYSVESSVTLTGAMADHRLALAPSRIEGFARALAHELGVVVDVSEVEQQVSSFARAAAADLRASSGAGIVLAGPWQPPVVHALAHAINAALSNAGETVEYTRPVVPEEDATESLRTLVADVQAGHVTTLVILGGNPVYDAPADLDFASALQAVPLRVHLSLHVDETSRLCNWHVPQAHFLESWSDARAHDGTASVVQPLIAPLYRGKTAHELVAALAREPEDSHDLVRAHWKERIGKESSDEEFERVWRTALHDGFVSGTGEPRQEVKLLEKIDFGTPAAPATGLEVALRPDASVHDGRFANNGWLQETPRPLSRITWDNAALVSPATAERLGLASNHVVTLTADGRSVEAPVWITPGHPDGAFTLHLGYGRSSAGRLGDGVGFDAYRLRTSTAQWALRDVRVEKKGRTHELASVQHHARMEGRDLVRVATFDRFKAGQRIVEQPDVSKTSLYPDHPYEGHAWGLVIDLNACIGCHACMVACQSENNVPVVGREEVLRGREMHWIRIDRYYEGGDDEEPARTLHQPVPCMQCENAPCELVCPVGATIHGPEGLNEMVYNRCVGTRYCSNNCPYKVRRFNFFHFADYHTESFKLGNNPDVTVRSRGVMEKCTYCIQRINQARITAKKADREILDGEVKTACQQACPTQAIVFGDINDPESAVSALRRQPHHYGLLEELDTRPRTTYLAKLENPNPELGDS